MGEYDMVSFGIRWRLFAEATNASVTWAGDNFDGLVAATVDDVAVELGQFGSWFVTSEHELVDLVDWTKQSGCAILSGDTVSNICVLIKQKIIVQNHGYFFLIDWSTL